MPRQYWWVKFEGQNPTRYAAEHFTEFWERLREDMMYNDLRLEWIIRD